MNHKSYIFNKLECVEHKWSDQEYLYSQIISDTCFVRIFDGKEYKFQTSTDFLNEEEEKAYAFIKLLPNDSNSYVVHNGEGINISEHVYDMQPEQLYKALIKAIHSIPGFFKIELLEISHSTLEEKINNSAGLNYINKCKYAHVTVAFIVKDDNTGDKQSIDHSAYLDEYFELNKFIDDLHFKADKKLNPLQTKRGVYDLWFAPDITSYFIDVFLRLITGKSVINKSTCLKVGDKIFGNLDLIENPKGYITYLIDHDGNKLEEKYLIKNGIIQMNLLNNKHAAQLNKQPTGNSFNFEESVTNLEFHNLTKVPDNFTGLYISSLLGIQFNEKNGQFSASIQGFYMENNIKQYGVIDGTISFNITKLSELMLLDDIRYGGTIPNPSSILPKQIVGGV